ncbi:unnamed protein product [Lymnaea stagnalis]|uniref:Uncharacterized protein n=1 Tax=Lymnaea stagnalis TaxID=6523 RepID=A0AAV2IL12_LYMST
MDDVSLKSSTGCSEGFGQSQAMTPQSQALTTDGRMKIGLFAASRQPAKPRDIKSFQILHSPRVYGSAELLLQYESACRQQDQYLQEIKDLWSMFRSKSASPTSKTLLNDKPRNQKGYFWTPLLPLPSRTDDRSPNRACVLHARKHRATSHTTGTVGRHDKNTTAPPPKSSAKTDKVDTRKVIQPIKLPPIEELDRYETDYEPIEHIARRNQLNLNMYLKEGRTLNNLTPSESSDD